MQRMISMQFVGWALPALLFFSIVWKGGKSLEATWLLTGVACALTLLSWWDARRMRKQGAAEFSIVPGSLWTCVLLFILWTAITYVFSQTKNYGLDEVLRDGSVLLLFLTLIRLRGVDGSGWLERRIVATIVAGAGIALAIGILVYVLQPVSRFVGPFFDHRFHTDYWPNAWAQFLLLAWPLALIGQNHTKRTVIGRAAFVGLLIGGLLLSYSRGAFIAFGGQIALLCGVFLLQRAHRMRISMQSAIPAILCAIAVAFALFFGLNHVRSSLHAVESVVEKATFTSDEGNSSVNERRQFWNQAMKLAAERPLLGWGPYSFRFTQPRLMQGVLATSDHPHNVLLKLLAERGVPAVLLFLMLLGLVLWGGVRSERSAYLISLAGVLAHNLIDYNLQFVGIALPFWTIVAFLYTPHPASMSPATIARRSLRIGEIVIACSLLAIAIIEARLLVLSSLGRHAEAQGKRAEAIEWYERASPQRFSRDMHLSKALLLITENRLDAARGVVENVLKDNPEDPRAWKLKGMLAQAQNRAQDALSAYEEAYLRGKYADAGILSGYLDVLRRSGNTQRLERQKKEFDDLIEQYADAIEQNTHFIALSGNVEEFVRACMIMGELFPQDAEKYARIASQAWQKAQMDRARFSEREPGWLW